MKKRKVIVLEKQQEKWWNNYEKWMNDNKIECRWIEM